MKKIKAMLYPRHAKETNLRVIESGVEWDSGESFLEPCFR